MNEEQEQKFVTIFNVAVARGAKEDPEGGINGSEFIKHGLHFLGGCECCEASIAAYNAYPSTSGYWRCEDCIGDDGFPTAADFEAWCKREEERR